MTDPDGIDLLPESVEELDRLYGDAPLGVRANMITTLDGGAAFAGRTKAVTDPADQALLTQLRSHADVVLVGSATVAAENYGPVMLAPELRDRRREQGQSELPRLAIVSASGALSAQLRVFSGDIPPIVITTERTADERTELADIADIVTAGRDRIEAPEIVSALISMGLPRILCEGGPYLLSTLIEADLLDELCLTVSPYLTGSQPTTPQQASAMSAPTRLSLRHVLQRNGLLYLRYSRP